MNQKGKAILIWSAAHLILLLGFFLFPLYLQATAGFFSIFSGCILHDFLHLYCPFCGGTRSLTAILHGSFGEAFRYHALVPAFFLAGILYDAVVFYRILKGKKRPARIPHPIVISVAILILVFGYGILRNILMVAFGIDPIGDLQVYWKA